ncbi:MAG: hypothetical protein GY909_18005 [Oligoflexia bacterium]|nr:hypothetical protein [Oligoflexia bacterium]
MNYSKKSVIIIGAGPAGLLSGLLLSDKFEKITIVDRLPGIKRKACGEYLCPRGVELLDELGLLKNFGDFHGLRGMNIVSPNGVEVLTNFPEVPGFSYKGLSLNREVFEKRLLDIVKSKHNIEVIFNFPVKDILNENGTWTVFSQKNNQKLNSNLLIAADGRSSIVAKRLGHLKRVENKRVAIHCFLTKKREQRERFGEMHILEDGSYCGINPINNEEVNFSIVCDNSKVQSFKDKRDLIIESINSSELLKGKFNQPALDEKMNMVFPINAKNTYVAGRNLVYVGDAAGFIDPLTGEGIYNALKSSVFLNESLKSSSNIDSALQKYKRKKQLFFFQKSLLNSFFQIVIRKPWACELIAKFLSKKVQRGDIFVGIIGNIYSPIRGLLKLLKTV